MRNSSAATTWNTFCVERVRNTTRGKDTPCCLSALILGALSLVTQDFGRELRVLLQKGNLKALPWYTCNRPEQNGTGAETYLMIMLGLCTAACSYSIIRYAQLLCTDLKLHTSLSPSLSLSIYIYIYTHTIICYMYTQTYTCTSLSLSLSLCMYMYIYIYMYTHVHIHTYIIII